MQTLEQSYRYCRDLTQRTAHNFRFSFLTLPRDKRRAMDALYAFNRITDDLGDDTTVPVSLRRTRLAAWKESLRIALSPGGNDLRPDTSEVGTFFEHPSQPAIIDMVEEYKIPAEYLFAVIDGVAMDLQPVKMATFAELQHYCYHVAGAVGICCIHVWGFKSPDALPLAIDCGLALQLTNILRDLREDAESGRIYLPQEDLDQFGYCANDLQASVNNDCFQKLMSFECGRAHEYYARAENLFPYLEPCGRRILRAMIDIYGGVLQQIERDRYDVYSHRIALPKWKKLWYAGRAMVMTR